MPTGIKLRLTTEPKEVKSKLGRNCHLLLTATRDDAKTTRLEETPAMRELDLPKDVVLKEPDWSEGCGTEEHSLPRRRSSPHEE